MMNIKQSIAICALLSGVIVAGGAFAAQEIRDEKQCAQVMADTAEAIDENPAVEGKSEEILLAVMKLATQRCKEKNFEAAKDLLELARGMVSSE